MCHLDHIETADPKFRNNLKIAKIWAKVGMDNESQNCSRLIHVAISRWMLVYWKSHKRNLFEWQSLSQHCQNVFCEMLWIIKYRGKKRKGGKITLETSYKPHSFFEVALSISTPKTIKNLRIRKPPEMNIHGSPNLVYQVLFLFPDIT
jgi:hypothetical protein